jgi:hypothetical protein
VSATFPDSLLFEEHAGQLKYRLPNPNLSLSFVFGTIERNKAQCHIQDYAVSQSTLVTNPCLFRVNTSLMLLAGAVCRSKPSF